MLKQVIAIVFLVAFALQTFSSAFVVLDYAANTKAYASKCENKARPGMHCNGKCQMMKKLAKEEKKDEQNPERKGENKNETLSTKSFFTTSAPLLRLIEMPEYPFLSDNRQEKMPRPFFHPPSA